MDDFFPESQAPGPSDHGIAFAEAARVWARIALLSFGGPAGQIAVMHRILVEEKKWIGEARFLHALNFCMLLPGPEAQQLATYVGWLLHRTKGALVAGGLFILPGLAAIMALSWLYVLWGDAGPVAALFFGLKAAVLAIVFQAVFRIGARALGNRARLAVAAAAFVGLFLFQVPFPLIVLGAAILGYVAGRRGSRAFAALGHGGGKAPVLTDAESALGEGVPDHARPNLRRALVTGGAFLLLWLAPVAAILLAAGPDSAFGQIGTFFSQMAVVTFGGAYAVLAYVAQAAVEDYGWLTATEMLDGLGLAETTPGPLIMVTQFVGFLGAYRHPDGLPPLLAGTLGGLLTTWVTFTPCFLWILVGAPFIEKLRSHAALAAALAAITAAVVGVILNLAMWFALHFLFARVERGAIGPLRIDLPDWTSLDPTAAALSAAALLLALRFKAGLPVLLGGCAAAGLVLRGLIGI
ncbi:chromate efflux transporter [Sphingosinicella terrae]|uniref:chromate efflux transporter n=1 Tax=Sphingosinicella terrae TaxID=2172047 RepID=UPI000E0D204E|nr:chromate efflux transporter [Sphingosinicella terrae]